MSLCKSYIFKSINPQSSNLKRATAQLLLLRFFKCRLAAPIPYQQVINKFTTKKIQKYRSSIEGIRKVIVNCLLSLKQTIRKPPITNTSRVTQTADIFYISWNFFNDYFPYCFSFVYLWSP